MVLAQNDAEFEAAYEEGMNEIRDAGLEQVRDVLTQNHLADKARKRGE